MKLLIPTLLLVVLAYAVPAQAQTDPFDEALPRPITSNAWEAQDPRYDTPKQAVHRKAAWKAAQRRQRLESMKRIGYSPSRPPTSSLPFMSSPPRWIVVPAYYPISVMYYPHAAWVESDQVR